MGCLDQTYEARDYLSPIYAFLLPVSRMSAYECVLEQSNP